MSMTAISTDGNDAMLVFIERPRLLFNGKEGPEAPRATAEARLLA